MARLARAIFPGHPHHVTQRGNGRAQTFFGDEDYALYRDLLGAHCAAADEERVMRLRRAEQVGRPIGDTASLDRLESEAGRSLKPGRPGPKPG